jgi:hypothetical protein
MGESACLVINQNIRYTLYWATARNSCNHIVRHSSFIAHRYDRLSAHRPYSLLSIVLLHSATSYHFYPHNQYCRPYSGLPQNSSTSQSLRWLKTVVRVEVHAQSSVAREGISEGGVIIATLAECERGALRAAGEVTQLPFGKR